MIIDVHAHYGSWPFAIGHHGPLEFSEILDRFGISHCIVSSSKAIVYDFREGNSELMGLLASDRRFYAYVVLNPNYPEESLEEARNYLVWDRVVGIKLHPDYSKVAVNAPATVELIRELEGFCPVYLVHTYSVAQARGIAEVARAFSKLSFIMGHTGGTSWREALEAVKELPNVYVEPCASYMDRDKVTMSVRILGKDRVLFGSDVTLINPAFLIGLVEAAGLSQEEKQAIYYDNAARLFGFDRRNR